VKTAVIIGYYAMIVRSDGKVSNYQVLLKNDRSIILSDVYGVEIKGDHIKFFGPNNDIIAYFDRNAVEGFFECE
jgi:hypothetical protein